MLAENVKLFHECLQHIFVSIMDQRILLNNVTEYDKPPPPLQKSMKNAKNKILLIILSRKGNNIVFLKILLVCKDSKFYI